MMKRTLLAFYDRVYTHLLKKTQGANHQIILFGIVMMISFPLLGILGKLEGFQYPEEFYLRIFATFLCACIAFKRSWPATLIKFFPLFWYASLIFCLPFFFSYLTLLNNASILSLINCVSAIFFLLLLIGAFDSVVLMIIGVSLAFLVFFMDGNQVSVPNLGQLSMMGLFLCFAPAITIGVLLARARELIDEDKLLDMQSIVGGLAHDLQTSLASIHLQTELQELTVNQLNNNPELQEDLKINLGKIIRGIEMGNKLITMQLHTLQKQKLDINNFAIHSIKTLLISTLDDYPLRDYEKTWIQLDIAVNFLVWIDELAFKNMLWNFLKNGLDLIQKTGDGKIKIWMELGHGENNNYNYLHFKDTAERCAFKNGEEERRNEMENLGLAYCELLMDVAGGMIYSNKGRVEESTHYILKFPKVD